MAGMNHKAPNFLVVGTAKAGTTSLASYLNSHPEIEIPRKETFYFNQAEFKDICLPYPLQRPLNSVVQTEPDYHAVFSNCTAPVIGEIGTGYLYHYQQAIPAIKRMLGRNVQIIIVLRNPIERAYSAYLHFKKDLFEKVPFEEALEMEYYRQLQKWDFMWHYKAVGLYHDQVEAYIRAFPKVNVLLYDDFKSNPLEFVSRIYDILGLSPHFPNTNAVKNVSGEARFPWFQRLITHENAVKSAVRPIARKVMNDENRSFIRKYLKSKNLKPFEPMSQEAYDKLREFYKDDINRLSNLLNRNLSHWINGNS